MEENNIKTGKFAGFFNFKSKSNEQVFYIIQVLLNVLGDDCLRGSVINVFVNEEQYQDYIKKFELGSNINVKVTPNFETGKVNYKIVD